jgi:hypothetical protein
MTRKDYLLGLRPKLTRVIITTKDRYMIVTENMNMNMNMTRIINVF